jgi:hypothetical protein
LSSLRYFKINDHILFRNYKEIPDKVSKLNKDFKIFAYYNKRLRTKANDAFFRRRYFFFFPKKILKKKRHFNKFKPEVESFSPSYKNNCNSKSIYYLTSGNKKRYYIKNIYQRHPYSYCKKFSRILKGNKFNKSKFIINKHKFYHANFRFRFNPAFEKK